MRFVLLRVLQYRQFRISSTAVHTEQSFTREYLLSRVRDLEPYSSSVFSVDNLLASHIDDSSYRLA
jgi:hypothetical protein